MFVCLSVCMYVCVYVCMYLSIYLSIYLFMFVCSYIHFYISLFCSDAEKYNARTRSQIGKTYKKAVYREYTNSSFTVQKPHRGDLGILGPTIKAYTYTEVTIHFKNLASRPYSIYVNGAIYRDKASEGRIYIFPLIFVELRWCRCERQKRIIWQ